MARHSEKHNHLRVIPPRKGIPSEHKLMYIIIALQFVDVIIHLLK